jgi:predicted nuclease of predicted toxin-antitoxin system
MKFLVDAHLPRRLARFLRERGHDAIHTLELPQQNRTPDSSINETSVSESRALITKDSDFVNSFLMMRRPYKLLLVSTGNIHNRQLEQLFEQNLAEIAKGFETHDYIELSRDLVILHS